MHKFVVALVVLSAVACRNQRRESEPTKPDQPAKPEQPLSRAATLERSCDAGHASDCTLAAWAYELGIAGARRDRALAEKLYRKACDASDLEGCRHRGLLLDERGDHVSALALFEKACDGGDTTGCADVGWARWQGLGTGADSKSANDLFTKSCNAGDARSCVFLAMMTMQGFDNVAPSGDAAEKLLRRTCIEVENPNCAPKDPLGRCVEHGHACDQLSAFFDEQDAAQATALDEKACAAGWQHACVVLAAKAGKDLSRAEQLARGACNESFADGCLVLGRAWMKAPASWPHVDPKAMLLQGCELDASSCGDAARLLHGEPAPYPGVPVDAREARRLYQKACDAGAAPACHSAGVMSRDGDGGDKDPKRADELFARACKLGVREDCK